MQCPVEEASLLKFRFVLMRGRMAAGGSGERHGIKGRFLRCFSHRFVVRCNLPGFMSYSKPWNKSIKPRVPARCSELRVVRGPGCTTRSHSLAPLWCQTISHDESSQCEKAASETLNRPRVFPITRSGGRGSSHSGEMSEKWKTPLPARSTSCGN